MICTMTTGMMTKTIARLFPKQDTGLVGTDC